MQNMMDTTFLGKDSIEAPEEHKTHTKDIKGHYCTGSKNGDSYLGWDTIQAFEGHSNAAKITKAK